MFLVGHDHHQAVAEFAIPELVASAVIADLEMAAAPLQSFVTVLDRVGPNPQDMNRIGGMELIPGPCGPELLLQVYEYYDAPADDSHTTVVLRDPANLAGSRVDGYYVFAGAAHTVGWSSPIPPEWQGALGGTHLSGGSSGIPIIGRLSVGPSAFVFDPSAVVGNSASPGTVATTALLDFSLAHPLHEDLSNDSRTNDLWTHLSRAVYGFIPPGTSTYVTLGHSGGHQSGVCYKCVPSDGSSCGGYCSNDASDYAHHYWLWDVADLIAVKEGHKNPWEPRPYAHGRFPTPFATRELGGGTWNPASGLLYLTVQRADTEQGTHSNPPIVVAYELH